ncbi:hypothetical protein MOSE0_M06348 [Monosporozyma servazzii]
MRYLLVGVKRFCTLGTALNRINGVRTLSTGFHKECQSTNVLISLMDVRKIETPSSSILQMINNDMTQGKVNILEEIFHSMRSRSGNNNNNNNSNIRPIREPMPLQQNNETLQLDSVLRKRRKKMKKHKLRKRRKREKALKRKIS